MKKTVPISEALAGQIHAGVMDHIEPARIEAIRQMKKDNPGITHKWLAIECYESHYAIEKALKGLSL